VKPVIDISTKTNK